MRGVRVGQDRQIRTIRVDERCVVVPVGIGRVAQDVHEEDLGAIRCPARCAYPGVVVAELGDLRHTRSVGVDGVEVRGLRRVRVKAQAMRDEDDALAVGAPIGMRAEHPRVGQDPWAVGLAPVRVDDRDGAAAQAFVRGGSCVAVDHEDDLLAVGRPPRIDVRDSHPVVRHGDRRERRIRVLGDDVLVHHHERQIGRPTR